MAYSSERLICWQHRRRPKLSAIQACCASNCRSINANRAGRVAGFDGGEHRAMGRHGSLRRIGIHEIPLHHNQLDLRAQVHPGRKQPAVACRAQDDFMKLQVELSQLLRIRCPLGFTKVG